ncbi:MAG: ketol-acid reductoisomerase, partial [Gemmatimonadetes bacterium]|nr:ketol-acid reductoisomerase [Gemmatimonadota bacterium]
MAKIRVGDEHETVITRDEWPLERARESLKDETIAVLGYGVQGPGQAMNLRDNGFRVIVGQRKGSPSWDRAVEDGWAEGETLFEIEESARRGTIVQYLLSDAGQIACWEAVKRHLTAGKCLYFSHGFGITYCEQTGIVPPGDIDVVLVAPKGSGLSLRRLFVQGKGLNSSYAISQDATGRAHERVVSLGIGVGSAYLFETDFQ